MIGAGEEQKQHNKEVIDATLRLETDVLLRFASYLDSRYPLCLRSFSSYDFSEPNARNGRSNRPLTISSAFYDLFNTSASWSSSSSMLISSETDSDSSVVPRNLDLHDISAVLDEIAQLGAEMHLHGINLRYLMALFELARTSTTRMLLATEAITRAAKHLLEEEYAHVTLR